MDKQPQEGESIVQIDPPYEGHYTMRMREYTQNCTWQEVLDFYSKENLSHPNFWWISCKEFPFPDQPERLNPETLDKEKDDAMGKYYAQNILLTEMR